MEKFLFDFDSFLKSLIMKKHHYYLLLVIALLSSQLIIVGCNPKSTLTISPTAIETISPSATVELFVDPQLTLPSIQLRPSATPQPVINYKTKNYHHPDDFFSLLIPETWSSSYDHMSASFINPQQNAIIDVQVINTGYALDSESFLRFIDAREENVFSGHDDYIDLLREQGPEENSYTTTKQLTTDEVNKSVETYYLQQEDAILILDFWADKDASNQFEEIYEIILESVAVNATAVENLETYSSNLENVYENDQFEIELPPYWKVGQSSSEFSIVDYYSSPDEHAVVQTIVYDDGLRISDRVAGELVLTLLREQYAKDISIISDTFIPGHQEKLTWVSKYSSYQGVTIFETRGSTLLVITMMWDNDFIEYYQEIIDTIISKNQIVPVDSE